VPAIIIICAVAGAVHTPTMSPYLPITTDEIISQDVAAAEASTVLHLHPRDEKDRQARSDYGSVPALPAADQQQNNTVINVRPAAVP
jgi:uncharacterized protein (DUF849 family)